MPTPVSIGAEPSAPVTGPTGTSNQTEWPQATRKPETETVNIFILVFAGLKNMDGFGQLASPPGAAAELAQDEKRPVCKNSQGMEPSRHMPLLSYRNC